MRAAFLALLAFLPGCFISVRSSGSDGTRHLDRSAADVRRDTRQRLAALELGMDRAAVDAVMGTRATFLGGAVGWVDSPHRESRYVAADGRAITVLSYYTDRRHGNDMIDDDELTPVVLADGQVIGFGRDFPLPPPR